MFAKFDNLMSNLAACDFQGLAHVEDLATIRVGERDLPIRAWVIGSKKRTSPCYGIFAGVHGLEQIGPQLACHILSAINGQLQWDDTLIEALSTMRIVSIPVINPGGFVMLSRSNLNGVDLMRNAPVEAEDRPFPLVGGHRLSQHLPWYRGESLELESRTLIEFVEKHMFGSTFAMSVDLHSGFGGVDRLWYPYARSKRDFPYYDAVKKLERLMDISYPAHVYAIESQSQSYVTHGDLWDYMVDRFAEQGDGIFLPLTLEMGSWMWLKKSPFQARRLSGLFNPILPHRYRRVLRRHQVLLEFLFRALREQKGWL